MLLTNGLPGLSETKTRPMLLTEPSLLHVTPHPTVTQEAAGRRQVGGTADTHWVLTTQHEADLPAGIRRDGAVSIFHHREQRLAELPHLLNEIQVQPLALTWARNRKRREVRTDNGHL